LALALLLVATPGCKPSPEGLVQRAVAARGGLPRLRAVQSQRLTGKISFGSQVGTLRIEFKRPNQMRMEIGLPGGTFVRLFDGTDGWVSDAIGRSQLLPMSAVELAQARREADMDGPLVDSEAKGIRITPAGQGQLGGRPTEDLDLVFRDGTVERYQLDPATHEPAGWSETTVIDGREEPLVSTVRATKRVEGLLFPTSIEQNASAKRPAQHILIEHIELNPLLDDARFRPPTLAGAALPRE
jgi:hypothetical protein